MIPWMTCGKCGQETIDVIETLSDGSLLTGCIECDLPPQPETKTYDNVCWFCGSHISSESCMKSIIPGMGYHCNICGKDLTEWKALRDKGRMK